jgi:hypothetical protein
VPKNQKSIKKVFYRGEIILKKFIAGRKGRRKV